MTFYGDKMRKLIIGPTLIALVLTLSCAPTITEEEAKEEEPQEAGGREAAAPVLPPRKGIEIPFEPRVRTDKDYYITGEDILIEFSLKRVNAGTFLLDPFPPITEIEYRKHSQGDKPVRSFPPGTEIRELGYGEVATYTLTWDQRDDNGQQVDYGYYHFKIRIGGDEVEVEFGLGRVLILPPEGVIEGTITINESQTVNGITITLKRVELSFEEAKFYVSTKRPEGYLPSRHSAAAEYQLDNGPIRNAGGGGFDFFEDRMDCVWAQVDPVAKNTKELTLMITRFGDWEGPWEFHVPLEVDGD